MKYLRITYSNAPTVDIGVMLLSGGGGPYSVVMTALDNPGDVKGPRGPEPALRASDVIVNRRARNSTGALVPGLSPRRVGIGVTIADITAEDVTLTVVNTAQWTTTGSIGGGPGERTVPLANATGISIVDV